MAIVRTRIEIKAPIGLCFDAASDITLHTRTVWKMTRERAVGGIVAGTIKGGERVTFEATHFLIRQRLTSEIMDYERPFRFVDEMISGTFKRMRHTHSFKESSGGKVTIMEDELDFDAPLGPIGFAVSHLVLKPYMRAFLQGRNRKLKQHIEAMAAEGKGGPDA